MNRWYDTSSLLAAIRKSQNVLHHNNNVLSRVCCSSGIRYLCSKTVWVYLICQVQLCRLYQRIFINITHNSTVNCCIILVAVIRQKSYCVCTAEFTLANQDTNALELSSLENAKASVRYCMHRINVIVVRQELLVTVCARGSRLRNDLSDTIIKTVVESNGWILTNTQKRPTSTCLLDNWPND